MRDRKMAPPVTRGPPGCIFLPGQIDGQLTYLCRRPLRGQEHSRHADSIRARDKPLGVKGLYISLFKALAALTPMSKQIK